MIPELLFIDDDYELLDIIDIVVEEKDTELIDINVDEDHTFCITEHEIISHNCKSMMRNLTFKAARARVPIIFTNHIYDNPAAMYPELVKKQSGGSGPIYLASLLVQLATRNEKIDKNEEQEAIGIAHNVSGVTLTAMTVKNRFVPPFLKAELYNNFRTGLSRYAGLADMAISMGAVTGEKSYMLGTEKIGWRKNWENDVEFWEKKGIPVLEQTLKEKVCYSSKLIPDQSSSVVTN